MTFKSFYSRYILNESLLMQIPNQVLGLHSMENIPENAPYGFWIDKSGNYIEVERSHEEVGDVVVSRAAKYAEDNNMEFDPVGYSVYDILLNQGWTRIVIVTGEVVYFETKGSLSPKQRQFLKLIQLNYNCPELTGR